jgi:outer membrane protein assembly factor BamE (lipoprotein component of BamABCDE complex)
MGRRIQRVAALTILFLSLVIVGQAKAETRHEFRAKFDVGMNQDQVVAAVGKPDEAYDRNEIFTVYVYRNRTEDPGTGRKDRKAKVEFMHGRVQEIIFER